MKKAQNTAAAPEVRGSSESKERLRLWLKLLRASRMVESDIRERFRSRFGTTLPRFDVMAALHRAPKGLRMSELSSELKVSNGNVTGIVDRLVAEGAVVRVPVENDRRAMIVRLTVKGREEFENLAAHHERWIDGLFGGVDAADAADLGQSLDRISAEAEEHMDMLKNEAGANK